MIWKKGSGYKFFRCKTKLTFIHIWFLKKFKKMRREFCKYICGFMICFK